MSIPSARSLTSWQIQSNSSLVCDAVNVLYQQTDMEILALMAAQTSSSLTTSGRLTSQQTSTIASSTSTPTLNIQEVPAGLTTGAKTAIGVTIPIVIIAFVVGIFFFMRRRAQRAKSVQQQAFITSATDSQGDWTHLGHTKNYAGYLDVPVEADAGHTGLPAELETLSIRPELSANRSYGNTHEMPSRGQEIESSSYLSGGTTAAGAAESSIARKYVAISPLAASGDRNTSHLNSSGSGGGEPVISEAEDQAGSSAADDEKLAILRSRIERVRKEKDRLNKLNELEAMEEELKLEIMDQQRKNMRL
jgi:hypothetical protein